MASDTPGRTTDGASAPSPDPAPSKGIWRNRSLLLLSAGQASTSLGAAVTAVTLMLRMHDSGHNGWWIAAMLMAETLPIVLLSPLTGLVADRYDGRRLLYLTSVWQCAACLALAYVGGALATVGLVGLFAIGSAFAQPVFTTLTVRAVERPEISRAYALQQTATGFIAIAGPGIGGVLVGLFGTHIPLLVEAAAALSITAVARVVRLRPRAPEPEPEPDPSAGAAEKKDRARDGFVALLADRPLAGLVGMAMAFIVVMEAVNIAEVFFVRDTLHASGTAYGMTMMAWPAGMLAGSALVGRFRTAEALLRLVPIGAAGIGLGVVLVSAAPALAWALPAFVLGGVANGLVNTSAGALIPMRVAGSVLGRVSAAMSALTRAAGIGALAIGGPLVAVLEPRQVFLLCGVAGLLVVLCTLPLLGSRRRPATDSGAVEPVEPVESVE